MRRAYPILISTVLALACFFATPSASRSDSSATRPASRPTAVTVLAVTRVAQYRVPESSAWERLTAGVSLPLTATLRTGPGCIVTLRAPDGQEIIVDRLWTVTIDELLREPKARVRAELGMQYGRVRYDVEAAGQEHDSTIRTPGSTLVVRPDTGPVVDNWPGLSITPPLRVGRWASPATRPATVPTTLPSSVVVTGIQGVAQVRESRDAPWTQARLDQTLLPTAEIRIGPRSAVRLRTSAGQNLTVDRLGTHRLAELLTNATPGRFGRTRYHVEPAGTEHDSVIRTDSAHLYPGSTRPAIHPFPRTQPTTTRPAALTDADEADVREFALRVFLRERGWKNETAYVGFSTGERSPDRSDPSDAFLARLADLSLPLQKVSERPTTRPTTRESNPLFRYGLLHRTPLPTYTVTIEDWLSDTEVVVSLSEYRAMLNGYGYRCIIHRKGGRWHMERTINGSYSWWRS